MDYVKLGSTGLEVSRICLGCMSFGEPQRGAHPWSIGPDKARPIIRQALDAGINFLDTANVYSDGSSEEIVGQALADFTQREEVVLATKVNGRMRAGANGAGLSRKAIMTEIDTACAGCRRTTSTSTRSTVSTIRPRSRRRWRLSTMS
jgi:aryl-alcohol dehydrogenase-like predicted oxidoreductase